MRGIRPAYEFDPPTEKMRDIFQSIQIFDWTPEKRVKIKELFMMNTYTKAQVHEIDELHFELRSMRSEPPFVG